MAVTKVTAYNATVRVHYFGLSTDVKPASGVNVGEVFLETDTGRRYENAAPNQWILLDQNLEALVAGLMAINSEILATLRVIQAATATVSNGQWETEFPLGV